MEQLCLRWRRTVVTNTESLRSLLLSGYKHDQIETLTQRAEWSQIAVDYC